jgi:hypothetical protein
MSSRLEMADAFGASRVTAGSVLADAGVDVAGRLASAGVLSAAAQTLSHAGSCWWDGITRELARLAEGFLAVDVTTVFSLGLRRTGELIDAAWRTRDTDESAVVELSDRTFTLTQRPSVDVMLGDVTLTRLPFELQVSCAVHGLSAVVRRARLAELTAGSADATVRLSCGGEQLAAATKSLRPQVVVALGRGLALVPAGPQVDLRGSVSPGPTAAR